MSLEIFVGNLPVANIFEKSNHIFFAMQHGGQWKFSGSLNLEDVELKDIVGVCDNYFKAMNDKYFTLSGIACDGNMIGFSSGFDPILKNKILNGRDSMKSNVTTDFHFEWNYDDVEYAVDSTISIIDKNWNSTPAIINIIDGSFVGQGEGDDDSLDNIQAGVAYAYKLFDHNKAFNVSDAGAESLIEISNSDMFVIIGAVSGALGVVGLDCLTAIPKHLRDQANESQVDDVSIVESLINDIIEDHESQDGEIPTGIAIISTNPDPVKSREYFTQINQYIIAANQAFTAQYPLYYVQWDQLTDSVSSVQCVNLLLDKRKDLVVVDEEKYAELFESSIMHLNEEAKKPQFEIFDHIDEIHKILDAKLK